MIDTDLLIFDSIFDTLPSGMILFEPNGTILRINQKAKEILGLEPDAQASSLNRNLPEYLAPLATLLQESQEDVNRSEISLTLPTREEESTIGFSLKHIDPPDGKIIKILTFSDITQVLKDRLAMDKIKDELNQSKKLASIGTMIAGVAHEMNNPLTGISMSTSLIKMNLERLKKLPIVTENPKLDDSIEKALQEVQKIARASEKAGVLVSDLLAYSKPSQIILIPLPLHELVMDMINAIKSHPQFSQFTIRIDGETDRIVQCDRVKLEQVFYNLIKNACDATEGKGTVSISYTEHMENDRLFVVAHVRDNGPGIDKTNIARIFDPFFTTKGHSGVGLGLSICYRTIEQHGGLLSVESVKWEGTEFKVSLPVYLEEESGKRSSSQ
jgi:two-component system, NtrC family, sensor kinase